MRPNKDYLKTLEERGKESKVYKDFQLIGLEIADLLHDQAHRALYIKLAKKHGGSKLMAIAKDISERKNVENKGAYFMTLITKIEYDTHDTHPSANSHHKQ